MPVTSKYANNQVEQILSEMLNVLDKHHACAELSLMVLGNLATNIINHNLSGDQREVIAQKFAQILLTSIDKE